MPAAEAGAALASDGVDLVDEDDTRRLFLGLEEQIPHPRGAHAHEHFHEIRPADTEERHPGLTRDGPRQQGLARARRAHQKTALGDPSPEAGKLFGVLEKRDDFLQLLLRFVHPGHVAERHLRLVLVQQARPALAEGHGLAASRLHLPHEEDPYAHQQQHGEPVHQQHEIPRRIVLGFGGDADVLLPQRLHHIRVTGREGPEPLAALVLAVHVLALDRHLLDVAAVHRGPEVAKDDLGLSALLPGENVEEQQEHQS